MNEKFFPEVGELDVDTFSFVALHLELKGDNIRAQRGIEPAVDSLGSCLSEYSLNDNIFNLGGNFDILKFLL